MLSGIIGLFDNDERNEKARKRISYKNNYYKNDIKYNTVENSISKSSILQNFDTMAHPNSKVSTEKVHAPQQNNLTRNVNNTENRNTSVNVTKSKSVLENINVGSVGRTQKKLEKLINSCQESEGCGKSNMKYLVNKFESQTNLKDHLVTTCYRKPSGSKHSNSSVYTIKRPQKHSNTEIPNLNKLHVTKSRNTSSSSQKEFEVNLRKNTQYLVPLNSSSDDNEEGNGRISDFYEMRFEDVISRKSADGANRSSVDQRVGDNCDCDNSVLLKSAETNSDVTENGHSPKSPSKLQRNSAVIKLHKIRIKTIAEKTAPDEPKKVYPEKVLDVINEMIDTEKAYVESLRCVVEDYLPEMMRNDIPPGLRGQKFQVFGNIKKIFSFHESTFLVDLQKCAINPDDIGNCFVKHEKMFDLYSLYNKNKPKSDEYMTEYGIFFEDKQNELGHSLNLSSQLLKPVQRLARYALLLKSLLKTECLDSNTEESVIKAYDILIFHLRHGDDLLLLDTIKCCSTNLNEHGKLRRQEEFFIMQSEDKKPRKIRVFLFEELILFSAPPKLHPEELHYLFSIKMCEIGLTDYGDPKKFFIWYHKYYNKKYEFEALHPDVKSAWCADISDILLRQADMYKRSKQTELAQLGICSETRIPIKELESDEDEKTSNKQYRK